MIGYNLLFNNIVTLSPVACVTSATALLTEEQAHYPGMRGIAVQPVGGDIYVGDRNVTTTNGIQVKDGTLTVWPKTRAMMYAISAGSVATRVMIGGE